MFINIVNHFIQEMVWDYRLIPVSWGSHEEAEWDDKHTQLYKGVGVCIGWNSLQITGTSTKGDLH